MIGSGYDEYEGLGVHLGYWLISPVVDGQIAGSVTVADDGHVEDWGWFVDTNGDQSCSDGEPVWGRHEAVISADGVFRINADEQLRTDDCSWLPLTFGM